MNRLLTSILLAGVTLTVLAQPMIPSATKYDWSEISASVVGTASTPREKAFAIYRWLCDNISYDTTYSIHDSDNAIEQRRGVCQAY